MRKVYAIKRVNEHEVFGLFETKELAEASIKLTTHKLDIDEGLIVEMMVVYSSVQHV